MSIEIINFIERDKLLRVHKNFFDDDSETHFEELLYVCESYDLIKYKKKRKLQELFYKLKKELEVSIKDFHEKQLIK